MAQEFIIAADAVDQTLDIFISDEITAQGLTGLVYTDITCYYNVPRGAATQITMATLASATAAHSDGGFIEKSAANMPGAYRFDIPDATVAAGSDLAHLVLQASGALDTDIIIHLNIASAANVVDEWETQSQADPTGFHVNVKEINGTSQTANDNGADINDIQSRIPAALVSGRMSSDSVAIGGSSTAADNLALSAGVIITGTAQTGTLSTTQMTTDLSESTNDHYIGRIIIWTSGALLGQATDITDYTGASGLLTFTAVTEAPSNGNTFIII